MSGDGAVASAKPVAKQVLAGKYRIEHELGHGGMGVVYAARHVLTGRRVAIKWMLAGGEGTERFQRFTREARAAGRIDHPNVVQVLDYGDDTRGPFIVMEFLHGEPLSSLLSRVRLGPAEAIDLLMPALRGVHAAHHEGVIHRDLKPENIFLCRTRDGAPLEAKVLDFGISKLVFGSEQVDTLTRPGSIIGTPHYMAPERVRGQRETDRRSDVYSFGVILYEVLTGRLPYDTGHVGELIVRISTQPPAPLRAINPAIPAELEAVVLKAMARRITDRYPDIESLALALEAFAGEQRFRTQRRDPTGQHRTDLARDAENGETVPTVSGERPTTLEPITAVALPRRLTGKRLAIAAAVLLAVGAGSAALFSGDANAPAATAAITANPAETPPAVSQPPAEPPRTLPAAVLPQAVTSAPSAAASASPKAPQRAPEAARRAPSAASATAASEPARAPKKRVRVARGRADARPIRAGLLNRAAPKKSRRPVARAARATR